MIYDLRLTPAELNAENFTMPAALDAETIIYLDCEMISPNIAILKSHIIRESF